MSPWQRAGYSCPWCMLWLHNDIIDRHIGRVPWYWVLWGAWASACARQRSKRMTNGWGRERAGEENQRAENKANNWEGEKGACNKNGRWIGWISISHRGRAHEYISMCMYMVYVCKCVFVALMWRQKTLIKSELAQLDLIYKDLRRGSFT